MSQKQKKEDCCFSWFFFQMYWIFRAVTPNFILSTYIQGNLLAFYILLAHYERITPLPDSFFPKRQPKPAKSGRRVQMFSRKQLIKLILPLVVEQFLAMTIGIADTLMVATCGEAAVSGVSLVNQFNTIFIYLFTALASGGAVVISQYIGRKKNDDAGESASQLLSFSTIFSILIAVMVLIGNEGMLRLMFGKVEDSVMHSCITYLRISAYSYPALAVYNAGAALFRSIGKTSVTMYLSVISNIINVIGNFIGVFVLRAGVAGVAYPSLIARTFSAVMITVLCFQRKNEVFYRCKWIFRWNVDFMKQILKIAIPNGMENGVFQLVKVALSGIVALFGTYQIAANGVAQSIWSLAALAGVAMGPVGRLIGYGWPIVRSNWLPGVISMIRERFFPGNRSA